MSGDAAVRRDGDVLRLTGCVDRAAAPALWRTLGPLRAGVQSADLSAVERVDSAGLALLAELAGGGVRIDGSPPGLVALRDAYRLDASLGFSR